MKIKMMVMMVREEAEESDNTVCCSLVDSFIHLVLSKVATMIDLEYVWMRLVVGWNRFWNVRIDCDIFYVVWFLISKLIMILKLILGKSKNFLFFNSSRIDFRYFYINYTYKNNFD